MAAVDYSATAVPDGYKCAKCQATNVKLWREHGTTNLLCARCAAEHEHKDISDLDAGGTRSALNDSMRTDQIGWYLPAVPSGDGYGYWAYGAVPDDAIAWWKRLPTLAEVK